MNVRRVIMVGESTSKPPGERQSRRSRLEARARLPLVVEDQCVPVQIPDAELPATVERVVDLLDELDPDRPRPAGLPLSFELARLQHLVQAIDLVRVEPQA